MSHVAIVGGKTSCAESEGLCDLPFSHTAILRAPLLIPDTEEEFTATRVTENVSLWIGLSPLALSRPLFQSLTRGDATPGHHCLQITEREKQRELEMLQNYNTI